MYQGWREAASLGMELVLPIFAIFPDFFPPLLGVSSSHSARLSCHYFYKQSRETERTRKETAARWGLTSSPRYTEAGGEDAAPRRFRLDTSRNFSSGRVTSHWKESAVGGFGRRLRKGAAELHRPACPARAGAASGSGAGPGARRRRRWAVGAGLAGPGGEGILG